MFKSGSWSKYCKQLQAKLILRCACAGHEVKRQWRSQTGYFVVCIVFASAPDHIITRKTTLDNASWKSERISFLSPFQGSSLLAPTVYKLTLHNPCGQLPLVVKVARNLDSHLSLTHSASLGIRHRVKDSSETRPVVRFASIFSEDYYGDLDLKTIRKSELLAGLQQDGQTRATQPKQLKPRPQKEN